MPALALSSPLPSQSAHTTVATRPRTAHIATLAEPTAIYRDDVNTPGEPACIVPPGCRHVAMGASS